jgi:hypothetical protein
MVVKRQIEEGDGPKGLERERSSREEGELGQEEGREGLGRKR